MTDQPPGAPAPYMIPREATRPRQHAAAVVELLELGGVFDVALLTDELLADALAHCRVPPELHEWVEFYVRDAAIRRAAKEGRR